MKPKMFKCQCESHDHIFYIEKHPFGEDIQDPAFQVCIHLADLGFWYRLKYAFKYLFNLSNNSAFDTVLLSKSQAQEIIEYLNDSK